MTTQHIDVGHGTVRITSTGEGPDLVFVHGWPTNGATWNGVVRALQGRFRCHQLDLPGAGGELREPRLHFRDHAVAVARTIDALDLSDVVLVGHDSGGAICRFAADRIPERVARLVISGSEIPGLRPGLIYRLKALALSPGSHLLLRGLLTIRPILHSEWLGFGSCFADPTFVEGDFRARILDPLLDDPARMEAALVFIRQFDLAYMDTLKDVHARTSCPTLLIWGDRDPLFPIEDARRMMEQFAGPTEMEVLEGGRLFAHEDLAEAYAERLSDWLERTRARVLQVG